MPDNYLKHFGVLGMKWGRRSGGGLKKKSSTPGSKDHEHVSALRKKKLKELSNEELAAVTKRLDLEKRYRDLNPSTVRRGTRVAGSVLGTIGKIAAAAGTVATLAATGKKIYDRVKGKK